MSRHLLIAHALIVCLALSASGAAAATPLTEVAVSPDTTTALGGATVADENVGSDDLLGTVVLASLGGLPVQSAVNGYHRLPDGTQLVSFESSVVLPGGVTTRPGDVTLLAATTYTILFKGAASGVPTNVGVDAVSVNDSGDLVLSFDVTTNLGGVDVRDEDLVVWDGNGFGLFLDGSAAGIAEELDLDAAHLIVPNGHILLSFDIGGNVGGVNFSDEDLLEYDPVNGTWDLAYDGSALHGGWPSSDLEATYAVPTGSGGVPDGMFIPGVQLWGRRVGTDVELGWAPSCVGTDADYAVYEGTIGDFTSHVPAGAPSCTTGGATTTRFTPAAGNRYFLVVPQGQAFEGSYGFDSGGAPRARSGAACQVQFVSDCD